MIKRLVREFVCDYPHCLAMVRIVTGSMECGTNDNMENKGLIKRGWLVYGFKHYCKAHKSI